MAEGRSMEDKRAAAYVAWGTFKNQLNNLSKNGLPGRIDRSVFIGLAGGTQTQIVATMKFLGLVDEKSEEPTDILRRLVREDEQERKALLRQVFESSYPALFKLDLTKASPDQFAETMSAAYNVSGSTLQKASRFFLSGAKDIGIEISSFLEKAGKVKRIPNGRRKKAIVNKEPEVVERPTGDSRTVKLASGGTLTVSTDLGVFALNAKDRGLFLNLIEQLDEYEKSKATSDGDESGPAAYVGGEEDVEP